MTISIDAEIVINRTQCQSWFFLIQNERKNSQKTKQYKKEKENSRNIIFNDEAFDTFYLKSATRKSGHCHHC